MADSDVMMVSGGAADAVVREDGSVDSARSTSQTRPASGSSKASAGRTSSARSGARGEANARPGRTCPPEGTLYAEIDGQFTREGGSGSVLPVFEVPGDLDMKTGDVDFFGTVMIHGHVQDGFTVKAGGNVFVMGTVGEARIHAGGQVIVGAGSREGEGGARRRHRRAACSPRAARSSRARTSSPTTRS
jgi:hypothetical protein